MSQSRSERISLYDPQTAAGGARSQEAIIWSLIGKMGTVTICKVVKVNGGGVAPVGYVDILPLVQQIDGAGNIYENAIVYNVPYFRYQGGANAVILDPKAGDLGFCFTASRDISKVKRVKDSAPPGSKRKYDMADSLYIGGLLNGTPSQFMHFKDGGIDIISPGKVTIKASEIELDAPVKATSTIQASSNITDNAATNSQSMAGMRALYNSHTHHENGQGANTSPPNQKA
ncbi:phage baseplate protein [Xenorhabdus bovienii]|uniref:Phage baseplate protein n=1 Tax=Xenorhabdus bovienii TaxID=40576 RepID=A0AAJ1JA60_XENBV|nr:phage baseplate protein [Xenorhabdus bovienii]MDE1479990.1 phage baseplate protein [Xenorhabdus bovienii]MDE9511687.1 phage baseplate protein [Xenorhabdus bovienii]MDE9523329.1 phage baseplate protein [Xenorhabdus bovienii]